MSGAPDTGVEDSSAPGPNLLANGHCDQLDGWGAYNGTLTLSDAARTGSGACMVCTDSPQNRSSLDSPFGVNEVELPMPGATFRAEAWVQLVDEGATVFAALRTWDGDTQTSLTEGDYQTPPAGEWIPVEVTHQVPAEQQDLLDFYVYQFNSDGGCMLVDDLRVERLL